MLAEANNQIFTSAATASWVYAVQAFTYYGQEKSTSCGAAVARMVIKALTGTNYSESVVRTGCLWNESTGTTLTSCVSYVNKTQHVHTYASKYSLSHSAFTSNIYTAVSGGAPAMVCIVTDSEDGWLYNSTGHALAIYAVMSDKSQYKIADPLGGYKNKTSWKLYTKTDSELFGVYAWTHGYAV